MIKYGRYIALSFLFCVSLITNATQNDTIPPYFEQQILYKVNQINKVDTTGNSFLFFTDTHILSNKMSSPSLIRYVIQNTKIERAIWGGDAVGAYGTKLDIDKAWDGQKVFDEQIIPVGKLYKLRGNHDFTIRTSSRENSGITFSQEETALRIFGHQENDIIRNINDPNGCYYYFDDEKNRIRFIALDATDSVKGENVPWGTIFGVGEKQLSWIVNEALLTIEDGYDIVFLSHVPIIDTINGQDRTYRDVLNVVNACAKKEKVRIKNVDYDFSLLRNVDVLMFVSGHHHHDMQTFHNGVLHVMTASDAAYQDYKRDPFVKDLSGRAKGTVNEQCFDCFCIDKRNRRILSYRIGVGGDRIFHTEARVIGVGDVISLKRDMNVDVEWKSYNSFGNTYSNYTWSLKNDVVSVDDKGNVVALKKGEAVVLALDSDGNKELFSIIVK